MTRNAAETVDAFDADVLIYAVDPDNHFFGPLRRLLDRETNDGEVGIGSVLLLPELFTRPTRQGEHDEILDLARLLVRIDLIETSERLGLQAAALGAKYGLNAADAIHLATAVDAGADRFITNNRRDFTTSIDEIDITYPDDL